MIVAYGHGDLYNVADFTLELKNGEITEEEVLQLGIHATLHYSRIDNLTSHQMYTKFMQIFDWRGTYFSLLNGDRTFHTQNLRNYRGRRNVAFIDYLSVGDEEKSFDEWHTPNLIDVLKNVDDVEAIIWQVHDDHEEAIYSWNRFHRTKLYMVWENDEGYPPSLFDYNPSMIWTKRRVTK